PPPNGLRLELLPPLCPPFGGANGESPLPAPGTEMLCPPGKVMLIEPFGPKLMPPGWFWLCLPLRPPPKKPPFGFTTRIQLAVVEPSRVATSTLSPCASAAAP